MKRKGKGRATRTRAPRATKRARPRSPKAIEIVDLVEAISSDFGTGNGVHLGQGLARMLADVYRQRGNRIPDWVQQLVTHYTKRSLET